MTSVEYLHSIKNTEEKSKNLQDKRVVIKYGGSAMTDKHLKNITINDILLLRSYNLEMILVHGGGPEIEAMLRSVGKESRFVNGLRYTDRETMDIVQMVLCGKINKELTAMLQCAVGLCGMDDSLLCADKITKQDLGFVGEITKVNSNFICSVIEAGLIPIIAPVALNNSFKESLALNINADTAAAKIAAAMCVDKLILITDVPGILRDVNDSNSLIAKTNLDEIKELIKDGKINKGMLPKVECAETALKLGVQTVHIIDGRVEHSLLSSIFSDSEFGTTIEL
jgi:acetylglutamate kinase